MTSKWRGIHKAKGDKSFTACIGINQRGHHIAKHQCQDTLAMIWNDTAYKLRGPDTRLNESEHNHDMET